MSLTTAQKRLLAKAPKDFEELPVGVGCANRTLDVLDRKQEIELILDRPKGGGRSVWQWRRAADQ